MHLHVAQDPRENNATLARSGLRAVPYLDSIGLLGPDLLAVHLSTATPDEVALVAQRGARMICCSNSIGIIDGVVPPAALFAEPAGWSRSARTRRQATTRTTCSPSCAPPPCSPRSRPRVRCRCPPGASLRMATIDGARVLGVGDVTGSLEVGKEADLLLLDLTRPPLAPVLLRPARNLVPNLVYAETGANVTLTMVAGQVIYADGEFPNVDRPALMERVAAAGAPASRRGRRPRLRRVAHRPVDARRQALAIKAEEADSNT